jgi:hypothetical protein
MANVVPKYKKGICIFLKQQTITSDQHRRRLVRSPLRRQKYRIQTAVRITYNVDETCFRAAFCLY